MPLERLAAHLRLCFARRPLAADTVRGITDVWCADLKPRPTPEEVLAVLQQLHAEGLVVRVRLPDGGELWRLAD